MIVSTKYSSSALFIRSSFPFHCCNYELFRTFRRRKVGASQVHIYTGQHIRKNVDIFYFRSRIRNHDTSMLALQEPSVFCQLNLDSKYCFCRVIPILLSTLKPSNTVLAAVRYTLQQFLVVNCMCSLYETYRMN